MNGSDVTRSHGSLAGLGGVESTSAASAAERKTETALPDRSVALGTDQATLSAAGGLVAASAGDGDVRLDKVASLKAAIDAGTYNVPSGDVAEKLITNLLG